MEKDHLNDKVLDKEKALSAIKTSYLNSYKVIVLVCETLLITPL